MTSVFKCSGIYDYPKVAKELICKFPNHKVFAFQGEMGVGKTTLIKSICEFLNIQEIVTSPTFSIVNEYKNKLNISIYHFDFYRINKISEVFDLGYEEYFYSGNYCFIEWPDKMEELLPENFVYIKMYEKEGLRYTEF